LDFWRNKDSIPKKKITTRTGNKGCLRPNERSKRIIKRLKLIKKAVLLFSIMYQRSDHTKIKIDSKAIGRIGISKKLKGILNLGGKKKIK
jgi:hypothetical protein